MKRILTLILITFAFCFALASCGNDSTAIEISNDGYVIVNGVKTEHKVETTDEIAVNADGYVVVNGVATNIAADKADVVTVDEDGYVIVNGSKTEYKTHTTDEIAVNADGYVVVNGIATNIVADKDDVVTVDEGGYVIVNGVKTEHKIHTTDEIIVDEDGYVVVNGSITNIAADKEDIITVDADGFVIVNGVKTDNKVHTTDDITVNARGYVVVNGVKTEYKVHTADEITVNAFGYVVVNGVRTQYKIHVADEITVNEDNYVVVNGAITDIVADKADEIAVSLDGYLIVNDVKTEYKVHKDLPALDYREYNGDYSIKRPGDLRTLDYWFYEEMGVYHAFFLEEHKEYSDRATDYRIGHSVSLDFLNWTYVGTALEGYTNGWDDRHLATGSIAKYNGEYYMMYTGHSSYHSGMGLAKSKDLYTWERVGDEPVISAKTYYTATYKGEEYRVRILADPYIYPEKIDGYFYVFINSWAVDMPVNNRGCQLMFRSKNMIDWEPYKIAIITEDLDRLETAQVWEHDGKWYMSFGGCYVDPEKGGFNNLWNDNFVYMSDSFDGPYEKQEWSRLVYEDAKTRPYIQKQIRDPYGDDVMLASAPYEGVLWPYRIVYGEDGSISLKLV